MRFFLAVALLTVPASSIASTAGGHPQRIFQCSFGKKEVLVSRAGPLYLYSFGIPGRPEVQIVGDPRQRNVFASGSFGTLDGFQNLRIANGRYSYVVFFNGLTETYKTPRASIDSGLAVFDGTRRISKFSCKSGIGFQRGWDDASTPPEDPIDFTVE